MLPWPTLKTLTRAALLELLDEPNKGILRALDSAWRSGACASDQELTDRLLASFGQGYEHPLFGLPKGSTSDVAVLVEHFEDTLEYELGGTMVYNTLILDDITLSCCSGSSLGLLRALTLRESATSTAITAHRTEADTFFDEIESCSSIFHVLCFDPEPEEHPQSKHLSLTPLPASAGSLHAQLRRMGVCASLNMYFTQPAQLRVAEASGGYVSTDAPHGASTQSTQHVGTSPQSSQPPLGEEYLHKVHAVCSTMAAAAQSLRDTYTEAATPLVGHMALDARSIIFQRILKEKAAHLTTVRCGATQLLAHHAKAVSLGNSEAYLTGLMLHHLVLFQSGQMVLRPTDMNLERLDQLLLGVSKLVVWYTDLLQ